MLMNEAIKTILKRRSVRQFRKDQIKDSDLKEILNAAIHAPSAQNLQKWHFTVVQDKAMLDRMVEITKTNMRDSKIPFFQERISSPDYNTYYHAPTVILISGDEKHKFIDLDCGLAAQNILLAAESLGISSVIMTSSELLFASKNPAGIKKELGIPEGYRHICVIALGYREGAIPAIPDKNRNVINYIK
jgi:nitroreductase